MRHMILFIYFSNDHSLCVWEVRCQTFSLIMFPCSVDHGRDFVVERKIRTHLDLLSIPQSGGENVKTFRWDHRLQIQNLFMVFKRVAL